MLIRLFLLIAPLLFLATPAQAGDRLKVLIIDGQNNHAVWPKATVMMKRYLEESGRFDVEVERTAVIYKAQREADYLPLANAGKSELVEQPVTDSGFAPDFSRYDVVVSNFGWRAAPWPEATQRAFEAYVAGGGGFVSIHAADNSFPEWTEYNRMTGLGGWDRDERWGPYVYYTNDGQLVRDDTPGPAGAHGPQHEFPVTIRVPDHPITRGMPTTWLASKDELYATLRGPAENMTVLATGKDQTEKAPTDRHEPIMMVIEYGKGRVFHLTLGHDTEAYEGVGFIVSLQRGTEWAATGEVSQSLPPDFPTADAASSRSFEPALLSVSGLGWTDMLDADLSQWEVWTGVIPEVSESDNRELFTTGTPYGLGDPYAIFSVQSDESGKPVLAISGEYYAGLTTLKSYADYHLTLEFKWGEAKHNPRKARKRDNGILYHCYGEHGAFWEVWKRCLELQVQEEDMGDLFTLAGTSGITPRSSEGRWDPDGTIEYKGVKRGPLNEKPHGEWNRLDLYVIGDRSIHVVNGMVVLAQHAARDHLGKMLSSGQIQLQSEGAEAYYRDIRIRPLTQFPEGVAEAAHMPRLSE